MSEEKKTSLGEFDYEIGMVREFLNEGSWEKQIEECEEWDEDSGMRPPDWLVEWSKSWRNDPLFSIEGDDWWMCEYQLVFDDSSGEVWGMIYQSLGGDDGVSVEGIGTATKGEPTADEVWEFVRNQLETLGDYPLCGTFTIDSTEWLPPDRMAALLKEAMAKHGESKVGGLSLEKWLLREYGDLGVQAAATEARDD